MEELDELVGKTEEGKLLIVYGDLCQHEITNKLNQVKSDAKTKTKNMAPYI